METKYKILLGIGISMVVFITLMLSMYNKKGYFEQECHDLSKEHNILSSYENGTCILKRNNFATHLIQLDCGEIKIDYYTDKELNIEDLPKDKLCELTIKK
jgi:hypothetical protein